MHGNSHAKKESIDPVPEPFMAQEEFDSLSSKESDEAYHSESIRSILPCFEFPEEGIFDNKQPFTIELREADLGSAFNLIGEMGKVGFLYDGDFSDPVGVSFNHVRLDDAFRTLLDHYKCTVSNKNGMYLISRFDPYAFLSHIFHLRSVSAMAYRENIETLLGSECKPVITPEGNAVMLTATLEIIERLAMYLDSVDQPERQVLIEARVVEVVLTDLLEMGTELNFLNIHMDDTTSQFLTRFLPDSTNGTFSFAGDNAAINGTLRALKELTSVEILSRPKVLAKDGEEAKIEVIEEVPYISATATTTGGTTGVGTSTLEQVEFKEVGIKLKVTPFVRGNNSVELKIVQDASEQMGTFENVPVVDHRMIDTTLVVRNGETIVIGGLIKTLEREEESGIPWLMDIPLLGHLFKLTRAIKEKRELIILINPTVVRAGSVS